MRFVVLAILIVLGCGNLAAVQAGLEDEERDSLRGLPGVKVLVERIHPDASADGLSTDAIQTAVELILRSSGIRVLSASETYRLPSAPYLYVNVNSLKGKLGVYAYGVTVQLEQVVELLSGGRKHVGAATWTRREVGIVGHGNVRTLVSDSIEPLVKQFANDFLAANPR